MSVVRVESDAGSVGLDWVDHELGGADLGDARRTARLLEIVRRFMGAPLVAIPQATGDWAGAKAAYRFMDNDQVDPDAILAPHRDRTAERAGEHPVVLAIGDTTMLDYTSHPRTTGLGPLSDLDHRGFVLHPTLVVTPERVPLGLIDHLVWARDEETFATGESRPAEERESSKWLSSLGAADALQRDLAGAGCETTVVSVFDREGDTYDVLASTADTDCELLVRAKNDRRVDQALDRLFESMGGKPVAGTVGISLRATRKRKPREADLEVRFATLTLMPPEGRRVSEGLVPISVQVVYAEEADPPAGEDPVRWMLLTTVAVQSFDDACRILSWYCARWEIELFFRVLKSGCKTEERRLENAERLKRCLVLDMIIAYRVLYLTTVGRDTPDLPCTVIFEEHEWKSLYLFVYKEPARVPSEPPTLREVTRLIGRLGGHLGRKSDGEPGQTTMWRGLSRLSDISSFYLLTNRQEHSKSQEP